MVQTQIKQPRLSIKQPVVPNNSRVLNQAMKLHQLGSLRSAERKYRSILKKYPNHTDALQFLAVTLQQSRQYCAARYMIDKAIKSAPDNTRVLINQAEIYRAQGDLNKAQKVALMALDINPTLVEAIVILAAVNFQQQAYQQAKKGYSRALSLDPHDAGVHNQLGNVLCLLGQTSEAIFHHHQALTITPDFQNCRLNLADTLSALGDTKTAIDHYQKVLKYQPDNVALQLRLGEEFEADGDTESAIKQFCKVVESDPKLIEAQVKLGKALLAKNPQQSEHCLLSALELEPDNINARYWLGIQAQTMGQFKKATQLFKQVIRQKPDFFEAWHRLSQNRGYSPSSEQLAELDLQFAKIQYDENKEPEVIALGFALGRFHEQSHSHQLAFHCFLQANRLKAKQVVFDRDKHHQQISQIINIFNQPFFQQRQHWGNSSTVPVFIVGMPRSGTTLVEQILSAHSSLHGAGERDAMQQLVSDLPAAVNAEKSISHASPAALLNQHQVAQQALNYLDELQKINPNASAIIDKLPGNYLRLGLIHLLFPKARIIHCKRDPMDTCWSCYQQNFEKGLSFANDLENLAFAYQGYQRLMRHWAGIFEGQILEVTYEQLVTNPEFESRRLIQFCGAPWESAVLNYHQQNRPVSSASQWQVRQPLYQSSIGRWKLYEPFLQPLKTLLSITR